MSSMLLPIVLTGCGTGSQSSEKVIEKPDIKTTDGFFAPEVLEAFGRISEVAPSPDGTKIIFTLAYEDIQENKANAEIYSMDADGQNMKRLTTTAPSESNLQWIADGTKIAFLRKDDASKKMQIFVMNADGSDVKRVSDVENGIECFVISPDGTKIIYGSPVKAFNKDEDLFKDLPLTSGRVVDDLMYKHWDEWVTEIPHPFLADFSVDGISGAVDIMEGEPFECPMRPFGGTDAFAWSPDSKTLVYVSRKLKGQDYAFSTDSNLYLYDLASKSTTCLTEEIPGYDTNPAFSPDGKSLAWLSMKTAKFESDKKRLMILDIASKEKRDLTEQWDYWPEQIAWSKNGDAIWFAGYYQGVEPIFKIDVKTCAIDTVAMDVCDFSTVTPVADNAVLTLRHSMSAPNEICLVRTDNKEVKELTSVNKELLSQLKLGEVRKVMVPTTDGKEKIGRAHV